MTVFKYLILVFFLCILTGCGIIWTDDVFILTILKNVGATEIEMISEPDYLQIGSGTYKSKNDKVNVVTPTGVIIGTGETP